MNRLPQRNALFALLIGALMTAAFLALEVLRIDDSFVILDDQSLLALIALTAIYLGTYKPDKTQTKLIRK